MAGGRARRPWTIAVWPAPTGSTKRNCAVPTRWTSTRSSSRRTDCSDMRRWPATIRPSTATGSSTSSRTPTAPSTSCFDAWRVRISAGSSPWPTTTRRSTNGTAPTSAGSAPWSRTSAARSFSFRPTSAARRASSRRPIVWSSTTPGALPPSVPPSRRRAVVPSIASRFGVACSGPTRRRRPGLRPRSPGWTPSSAVERLCWRGPARCWNPCAPRCRQSR